MRETWLTSREVAKLLGVQYPRITVWIQEGKIKPPRRSGRCCRHRLGDIYRAIVAHSLKCPDRIYEDAERFVAETDAA